VRAADLPGLSAPAAPGTQVSPRCLRPGAALQCFPQYVTLHGKTRPKTQPTISS
jgi:hypothetical protein